MPETFHEAIARLLRGLPALPAGISYSDLRSSRRNALMRRKKERLTALYPEPEPEPSFTELILDALFGDERHGK
jgi:hypothetical protein